MNEIRLYIALYADEDISAVVIREIQKRGYDVEHARRIGHDEWEDEKHLEYAASVGRTLLTHNIKHFEPVYKNWWDAQRPHAGVIVSPQFETGEMVRRLLKLLDTVTADEMKNNYRHLGEFA